MDKLTIFNSSTNEVTLKSEELNTFDTVANTLKDIKREAELSRLGNEAYIYGDKVEESELVDQVDLKETLPPEEEE